MTQHMRRLTWLATLAAVGACGVDAPLSPVPPRAGPLATPALAGASAGAIVAPTFWAVCGTTFGASNGLSRPIAFYWSTTLPGARGIASARPSAPVFFDASERATVAGVTLSIDAQGTAPYASVSPIPSPCRDESRGVISSRSITLAYACGGSWRVTNANAFAILLRWSGGGNGTLGVPAAIAGVPTELFFDAGSSRQVVLSHRGAQVAKVTNAGRTSCEQPTFPSVHLEVVSGDDQTDVVGATLAVSPRVRVVTDAGEPVARVAVSFSISKGYGFITNGSGTTDASGEIAVGSWELSELGTHELEATLQGIPSNAPSRTVHANARDLAWSTFVVPGEHIRAIWGVSPTALFASGGDRTLDFWDGTQWSAMVHPSGSAKFSVHGRALNDVYAVGQWGAIHYDGQSWSPSLDTGGGELFGIWVAPDGQAFASGDGTFYHFDGAAWTKIPTGLSEAYQGDRLENVWGSSASDVYAVGWHGHVMHWDGQSLRAVNTNLSISANHVWGFGPADVYVTDAAGLLHFDGASWALMPLPSGVAPVGVWGSSPRNLYLSAWNGDVWRFDGRSWQLVTNIGATPGIPFGLDARHVYVGSVTSPGTVRVGS